MPAVTIRNLAEATHRALKIRAAHHGRSTEAEMRDILETAVRPETRLRLCTTLSERSKRLGLTNDDFADLDETLEQTAAKPMSFGP